MSIMALKVDSLLMSISTLVNLALASSVARSSAVCRQELRKLTLLERWSTCLWSISRAMAISSLRKTKAKEQRDHRREVRSVGDDQGRARLDWTNVVETSILTSLTLRLAMEKKLRLLLVAQHRVNTLNRMLNLWIYAEVASLKATKCWRTATLIPFLSLKCSNMLKNSLRTLIAVLCQILAQALHEGNPWLSTQMRSITTLWKSKVNCLEGKVAHINSVDSRVSQQKM